MPEGVCLRAFLRLSATITLVVFEWLNMSLFSCPAREAVTDRIVLDNPCLISDLHLSAEESFHAECFERFLNTKAKDYRELVILGDFFDYWVGDDAIGTVQHIVDALKTYAKTHKVFVMHGNRDFMLGNRFAQTCGATLLADPCVATVGNETVLLSHGDIWCTHDPDYQTVRNRVRSFWWQWLILRLPLTKRLSIARNAREKSKKKKTQKEAYKMDVAQEAIDSAIRSFSASSIIHGHTHKPGTYSLPDSDCVRIVLPDWRFGENTLLEAGFLARDNGAWSLSRFV